MNGPRAADNRVEAKSIVNTSKRVWKLSLLRIFTTMPTRAFSAFDKIEFLFKQN